MPMFEPFATDKTGGMGLGLVLCERIIERMGGRIELLGGKDGAVVVRIRLPKTGVG